jgi:hypothetical protein
MTQRFQPETNSVAQLSLLQNFTARNRDKTSRLAIRSRNVRDSHVRRDDVRVTCCTNNMSSAPFYRLAPLIPADSSRAYRGLYCCEITKKDATLYSL